MTTKDLGSIGLCKVWGPDELVVIVASKGEGDNKVTLVSCPRLADSAIVTNGDPILRGECDFQEMATEILQ